VGGCAPDVAGALGLARDAGDPEEVFEVAEALLARLFEKSFRRCHRTLS
jgi:hypothetical protein